MKEEYVREGNWKSFLALNSMTEEEYKEYYNKRYFPANVAQNKLYVIEYLED